MQKNYFIAQESSRYSVRKQDWFFLLFLYINVPQKIGFLYGWKLRWLPSSKDTAHVYIHKKQKNCGAFLHTKSHTLFKKLDNFRYVFIYKSDTLDVTGFLWNFWSCHLYTKSMTLCVTWRVYIQKARHFAKSKTICDTFLYQKIRHFCVTRFFIEFLKFAEGGGHLFIKKNVLCMTFLYLKINALCVTLLYTKSLILCVTF